MSKSIEKISNEFAREIFKTPYNKLDFQQRYFVFKHVKLFEEYLEAIKRKISDIKSLRLNGDQYWIIREWYYKRIPLHVVFSAIDHCMKWAIKKRRIIKTVKYFDNRVHENFDRYQRTIQVGTQDWGHFGKEHPEFGFGLKYDKWMYTAYRIYRKNFDYFNGPIGGVRD